MLSVYSPSLYEYRKWGIFSVISGYFYYANDTPVYFSLASMPRTVVAVHRPPFLLGTPFSFRVELYKKDMVPKYDIPEL